MIAAQLLQVEWIKTHKRIAFRASLLFFFGIIVIATGSLYLLHRQGVSGGLNLPGGWGSMVEAASGVGGLVLTVLVVLLTASEKTWRTERQNIIDGLSRTQYFAGKVILLMLLSTTLLVGAVIITSVFGVLDRAVEASTEPFINALSFKLLGGLLLRFLVVAAIAFCFSMVTTGSGAALACAFLFMMVQPILTAIIMVRGPASLRPMVPYLPSQVLDVLTSAAAYRPDVVTRVAEAQLPFQLEPLSIQSAVLVATAYAVLFAAGAWLSIRKRDL